MQSIFQIKIRHLRNVTTKSVKLMKLILWSSVCELLHFLKPPLEEEFFHKHCSEMGDERKYRNELSRQELDVNVTFVGIYCIIMILVIVYREVVWLMNKNGNARSTRFFEISLAISNHFIWLAELPTFHAENISWIMFWNLYCLRPSCLHKSS